MTVRLLLFATLAQTVGRREMTMELPAGATVDDALNALEQQFSDVAEMRSRLAFAVDMTYVSGDHPLCDGVEMALIPPVSGG